MKKIELKFAKRYVSINHNRVYEQGEVYEVSDDEAAELLGMFNDAGMPYFLPAGAEFAPEEAANAPKVVVSEEDVTREVSTEAPKDKKVKGKITIRRSKTVTGEVDPADVADEDDITV